MDESPHHVVVVTGIVRDHADRVLLVKTDNEGWDPPGGRVERGEDLVSALRREILEESGCEVNVGRLLGVYSNVGAFGVVVLAFACSPLSDRVRPGHECTDAGWFTPERAQELVTRPGARARLTDGLAELPGVVVRGEMLTADGDN